ncbi:ribonuclease E/G [Neokomagataea thailandica]|nr:MULTISPECIES: ribonuclease E/G [Neokomagataea]
MIEIRAACSPGEMRIAVIDTDCVDDDGTTSGWLDAAIWRPGAPDGVGDVHVVRVQTITPALGGMFVLLEGGVTGFMPCRKPIEQGRLAVAQVVRAAQNNKGLRLRLMDQAVPDDVNAPHRVSYGATPLEELAQRYPEAPIILDSQSMGVRLPVTLRKRCHYVQAAFDAEQEAVFDTLGSSDASIGGLTALFSFTPALVAIDLDSAGHPAGAQPDFAGNVAAFPALAREIRLRNVSGTLLIDAAGVRTRKRPALAGFLKTALATDIIQPEVLGATPSGLLEVVRKRTRPPMHEVMHSAHGKALAILRQILREGRKGTQLVASISVVRALERDPDALEECILQRAASLELVVDPERSVSQWSLV